MEVIEAGVEESSLKNLKEKAWKVKL